MATREVWEVWLDAAELEPTCLVGRLYQNLVKTAVPASFAYESAWLQGDTKFMLDPRLELYAGEQNPQVDFPAFGIFMDSAPDRWGRVLMERRELLRAEQERRAPRTLQETDFLLGVSDVVRMGALRFRVKADSPYVSDDELAAPPVTSLGELAEMARRIEEPGAEKLPEYAKWLAMLVAPGTSLGGARPKANFTQTDGSLWIAKFPAADDRYDAGGWEFVTHELAQRCGIWVPAARLTRFNSDHSTYCAQRFDRQMGESGPTRRMYTSAMTLLQRRDGESGASYLDLAQAIEDFGARHHIEVDLHQLFRRVLFNVLVGNRDDHLRNHGFIREATGWRLSPAFDVNPSSTRQEHGLTLDGKSSAPEVERVVATAELYRLTTAQANDILSQLRKALADWRQVAEAHGLRGIDIARMSAVIQA